MPIDYDKTITHPFDPTSIDVEKKNMSVNSLITMLQNDIIDLSPAFQRNKNLWTSTRQSQLIESLLLKLPLPSMYFEYDNKLKKYIVIDGLQRLCSLKNFAVDNTLSLNGLEFLQKEFGGKKYSDLTFTEKLEIGLQEISVNILKGTTPESAKFIIFKRINSAGTSLTNQEIRNALYNGLSTEVLSELSENTIFRSIGFRSRRMEDQEIILRFMAFKINGYENYNGRMASFLTNTMILINDLTEREISEFKKSFLLAIERNIIIFEKNAFRLPDRRHRAPSGSLFDVMTVTMSEISDIEFNRLHDAKDDFNADFLKLVTEDEEFKSSVSNKSDRKSATRYRHETIKGLIYKYIK